jgi:hypothetical protein
LSFLLRKEYKVFRKTNSYTGRTNGRLHSSIFLEFFQSSNFELFEFYKNELQGARAPK